MNTTSRSSESLTAKRCHICLNTDKKPSQLGGHSFVETKCKRHLVCHLECVYDNAKPGKSVIKRLCCSCGPGMSLFRNNKPLLEDACKNGDLEALKMGLALKPEGDCTTALSAVAKAVAEAVTSGHTDCKDYTECFRTLSSAIQNHADEHKKLCAQLATLVTGVGVAIAGLTTVEAAAVSAKAVAFCEIVGEIANLYITGFPIGTFMSMIGFGSLLSSWDLTAFPDFIAYISVALGFTALCLAQEGGENIGKKMGTSIYLEDGNTPLHIATQNGSYQCVKALVDEWEGRNQQKIRIIKLAFSTIMNAVSSGISASLEGFIERLSDSYNDLFFLTHRWDVNTANKDGYTPLHFAAKNNNVRCLNTLVKAGANINAREKKNGYTPLHLAAANGSTECLQNLLDIDGVDINRALHCAAATGSARSVKALLDVPGIQVNEKDNDGNSALHLAVYNGRTENVKAFLAFDRSLGLAPLHCAARNGDTEFVSALLAIDRSLAKDRDNYGWTALHFAADNGHTDTTNALLDCWRTRNQLNNINNKNIDGNTALHLAARGGYAEIVKAFLAIPSIQVKDKNNTGWTALDLATRHGHTACKELLEGLLEGLRTETGHGSCLLT